MSKADVVRVHLAPVLVPLIVEHRAKIVDSPRAESASRDACGGTVTATPKDAA